MSLDFFTSADMLGRIFWVCALGGTIFFLFRLALTFTIGDLGDTDFHSDFGSGAAFDFLSLNTVTAFVMMFGWSGLACHIQFSLEPARSIFISLLVGALSMLITAYLFQQAKKLTSTGSQFSVGKAVGLAATVYQRIPAEGKGKISVTIPGDLTREIDAISAEKIEIESQTIVKILSVIDVNTLSVKKV